MGDIQPKQAAGGEGLYRARVRVRTASRAVALGKMAGTLSKSDEQEKHRALAALKQAEREAGL